MFHKFHLLYRACPKVKTSSLHMVTAGEDSLIFHDFHIFSRFEVLTTVSLSQVLRDLSGCRCFQPVPRCTTCCRYTFANSFLSSSRAEWQGGTCCVPASWTPATQMNSILWVALRRQGCIRISFRMDTSHRFLEFHGFCNLKS